MDLKHIVIGMDWEDVVAQARKDFGNFNIEKTIKIIHFDPDQEENLNKYFDNNAVIKTMITPLQFFHFRSTKGFDTKYWLDSESLYWNLKRLKDGRQLYTPILWYDVKTNRCHWHEGRHRMLSYYIAGVKKVTILVAFTHLWKPIPVNEVNKSVLNKFKPYSIYKR